MAGFVFYFEIWISKAPYVYIPNKMILCFIFEQSSLLEDCIFKEHHNMNGYSSFESRPHSGWYLALTNDGRAKPGPKTAPGQRAVEFLPENV